MVMNVAIVTGEIADAFCAPISTIKFSSALVHVILSTSKIENYDQLLSWYQSTQIQRPSDQRLRYYIREEIPRQVMS